MTEFSMTTSSSSMVSMVSCLNVVPRPADSSVGFFFSRVPLGAVDPAKGLYVSADAEAQELRPSLGMNKGGLLVIVDFLM